MKIEALSWDSAFFEKEIARLELKGSTVSDAEEFLLQQPYDLVYVFTDQAVNAWNHKQFSANTFIQLMDEKLTYGKKISPKEPHSYDRECRPQKLDKLSSDLLNLVYRSGLYSRFRRDEHLNHAFEKLYEAWIVKSLREPKHEVIGLMKKASLLGFVSIHHEDLNSSIQLIATSEANEGKGYGKMLVEAGIERALARGSDYMRVATQAINLPARSFYEKMGFDIDERKYIYHFWNFHKQ